MRSPSESLFKAIVLSATDAIIVVDGQGVIEFANPSVERTFGYRPAELVGRKLMPLLCPEDQAGAAPPPSLHSLQAIAAAGTQAAAGARRRDAGTHPIELTASAMQVDGTAKTAVMVRDIRERRGTEERLRRMAHFDELSGLPNRTLFLHLLGQALPDAQRNQKSLAILFIDLDRFKLINETLGHEVGDAALRQVATRLTASLRQCDTIARFAGDEFVILMRDLEQPAVIGAAAQRILDVVAEPLLLDGQVYHLSASIGISTYPADSQDVQGLLRNANTALHRAKEMGKNNYQYHSAQMNLHSLERLALERSLRRALERDEFVLHYQPKIELATGRIVGMEALLRWSNPAMGMVSPARFVPLAEETGLIVPIGELVLRRACLQTSEWHRQGLGTLRVAVNLSARQLAHESLPGDVARALASAGLDAESLELEITESMVMRNPERAAALLHELRRMGVHLAVDDFGTGYSSLGYLKRFPVNAVKIDRSFIKDVPSDPDDTAITCAVIAMAHSLRLEVTAEGVETQVQADFLRQHGCNHVQGYHFSRPLAAADFLSLVLRQTVPASTIALNPAGLNSGAMR